MAYRLDLPPRQWAILPVDGDPQPLPFRDNKDGCAHFFRIGSDEEKQKFLDNPLMSA